MQCFKTPVECTKEGINLLTVQTAGPSRLQQRSLSMTDRLLGIAPLALSAEKKRKKERKEMLRGRCCMTKQFCPRPSGFSAHAFQGQENRCLHFLDLPKQM